MAQHSNSYKVTFPQLVDQVATATGTSERVSELFLKELFATLKQALLDGRSVTVDGLGTFSLEPAGDGHSRVTFVVSPKLASRVNEPFANFRRVELSDMFDDELPADEPLAAEPLAEPAAVISETPEPSDEAVMPVTPPPFNPPVAAPEPEPEPEPAPEPEPEPAPEPEPETAHEPEPETAPEPAPETAPDPAPETAPDPAPETALEPEPETALEPAPETAPEPEPEEPETPAEAPAPSAAEEAPAPSAAEAPAPSAAEAPAPLGAAAPITPPVAEEPAPEEPLPARDGNAYWRGFATGAAVAAAVAMVAWLGWWYGCKPMNYYSHHTVNAPAVPEQQSTAASDSVAPDSVAPAAEPQPAAPVVTDTITGRLYLTKMSRKHYVKPEFWVYIYLENKEKIENPNTVPPGTVLVIPPREKYGIDPDDRASVEKARRLQYEIYTTNGF